MTRFVIDEVILHNAYTGKNSEGNVDRNATHFVLDFCDSNHKLALNSMIRSKYHKLPEKLDKQKMLLNISTLIHQLLLDKTKTEYFEGSSFEFEGPKKCDKEFVKVTKESQGFLVTEDEPLINTIQEKNLSQQIQVKRVKEALSLL
jgi:hypothetical protein